MHKAHRAFTPLLSIHYINYHASNVMKQLHVLTDDKYIGVDNFLVKLEPVFDAGIDVLQLRFKQINKRDFFYIGQQLKPILKQRRITLLINDHCDISLALDCDGVHIGQQDLPYVEARKLLGKHKTIGLSISSYKEYVLAKNYDCDYFGVGPIFDTTTKKDANQTMGLSLLKRIIEESQTPCIAIGGINKSNAEDCILTGASGIAVCAAICDSHDTYLATKTLRETL